MNRFFPVWIISGLIALGIQTLTVAQDSRLHWSFQPLTPVPLSSSDESGSLDFFIEKKLKEKGLEWNEPADRRTLLRRLFLDMLGLPPSFEQIRSFETSSDPERSYREWVEWVLASPHYGERWAQHWLDIVRYADTHGYEVNTERENAWPYRDYIIRAFNQDKSYSEFVFDQIAGDTVGEDAATGFLVAAAALLPGQIGQDEPSKRLARQDALNEIVVGVSDTFLGLSVGCARCHHHKFDPISQKEYYQMQAFFSGVDYGDRPIRDRDGDRARNNEIGHIQSQIQEVRSRLEPLEPLASTRSLILIDDEDKSRTQSLKEKKGHGANPEGSKRGFAGDVGSEISLPNLSGGRYTWWENRAGEDVFLYRPQVAGSYRLWLSWGVHGSGVHTRDARYILDQDGNLETRHDQVEIAQIDQYRMAGVTEGESPMVPLWSGLWDAGVQEWNENTALLLRGGETGTGITADVILLEEADPLENRSGQSWPRMRAPVRHDKNREQFEPIRAKHIRFTSLATQDQNRHEPCLDELEIFGPADPDLNLAAATRGVKLRSSGNYSETGIHQLKHINDGQYGNSWSWISNEAGKGWVELELPEVIQINRVVWGRDREGMFKDRLALDYRIEVKEEELGEWILVASSRDRMPYETPYQAGISLLTQVPPESRRDLSHWVSSLKGWEKELERLSRHQMVFGGIFHEPEPTAVLHRGDPEQPKEMVQAGVLEKLGGWSLDADASDPERRVALARWLTREDHPLTTRVIVNRVWQYHFGTGLVDTPSDFGLNGGRPSHPELLDWLAGEFLRQGQSLKALHRIILLSRTYRQSNQIREEAYRLDGDNRLLWRFPMRRLEAEGIRDSLLMVSGNLNWEAGGPGFNFFKKRGGLDGYPPVEEFSRKGLRRMIYAHKVRMEKIPVFGAFDCPDGGQAMPKRSLSTTAIQALNLLNSSFVWEQSEVVAKRVEEFQGGKGSASDLVEELFRQVLGRSPNAKERKACVTVCESHGLAAVARALFNSNEFLFIP